MNRTIKELKSMIKDEREAPEQYRKLRDNLSNPRDKKIVNGIIKQEREHYKKDKNILRR